MSVASQSDPDATQVMHPGERERDLDPNCSEKYTEQGSREVISHVQGMRGNIKVAKGV